jgi:hypothetical protein
VRAGERRKNWGTVARIRPLPKDSPTCAPHSADTDAEHPLRQFPEGEGNWYRAQNEFMDRVAPRVGVTAIVVYHFLCRHQREERVRGVSVAKMVSNLPVGRTAVFAALSELEQQKAIRRVDKPGSESAYELLDLRRHTHPSATRTGDVRVTNRGCSRGEHPIRKARLQDCKIPIPPTPLSKGGDANTLSAERARERGQTFKEALKRELQDMPLNRRHLATDVYDRCFRHVQFIAANTGPILVETENPAMTAEALRKYGPRMKKLGKRVFGRDVEFQIADEREPETDDTPQTPGPNNGSET